MMRTRSLEIWHVPKRQNVHQLIGSIQILATNDFNGKSWNTQRMENFNTKLGQTGLTNNGRPLSQSARRTHEALLKYLGFIYINKDTTPNTLTVTNAGLELIRIQESLLNKTRNLRAVGAEEIKDSPVIKKQMIKLQLTNPVVNEDCLNILLFPFRVTLRLLLELDYLKKEEIAYIVFSMRKEDEFELTVEKIRNFRSLPKIQRERELELFKETEIGNLTLVQAPTAGYYMGLCIGTGICERDERKLVIKAEHEVEAKELVKRYKGVKPFNFGDDIKLWIDYFGDISKDEPPILVNVSVKNNPHLYVKAYSSDGKEINTGVISSEVTNVTFPMFKNEEYSFKFYSFENAELITEIDHIIDQENIEFDFGLNVNSKPGLTFDSISQKITSLISNSNYDSEYAAHIENVKKITGRTIFNVAQLRGGRLEYLFYLLLKNLKENSLIDDVVWNGRVDEFGIAYPTGAGQLADPDLHFFIGNNLYGLELTTIRAEAGAMQWSAEAASAHEHFMNINKRLGKIYDFNGIFSAPSISERVSGMYQHISAKEKIRHHAITIDKLIEALKEGKSGLDLLLNRA